MTTFTEQTSTTFEVITCGGCGLKFAVPDNWIQEKRDTAESFTCPNGCQRSYRESEAQRLAKRLEAAERDLRNQKCETLKQAQLREQETTAKEKAERKLRRVKNGVCPECKRSFCNLKQHMATKHSK